MFNSCLDFAFIRELLRLCFLALAVTLATEQLRTPSPAKAQDTTAWQYLEEEAAGRNAGIVRADLVKQSPNEESFAGFLQVRLGSPKREGKFILPSCRRVCFR